MSELLVINPDTWGWDVSFTGDTNLCLSMGANYVAESADGGDGDGFVVVNRGELIAVFPGASVTVAAIMEYLSWHPTIINRPATPTEIEDNT